MDNEQLHNELSQHPGREHLKKTRQGYDYLEIGYVKRRANEIFGPLNWTYSVQQITKVAEGSNSKGTHYVEVMVVVALTIHLDTGTRTYEEVGGATSYESEAEINATKAAISQGVKRCLANLGPAFGLHFYEEENNDQGGQRRRQNGRSGQRRGNTRTQAKRAAQGRTGRPPAKQNNGDINPGQIKAIEHTARKKYDMTAEQVAKRQGVDALDELTFKQAKELLDKMRSGAKQ